MEDDIPDLPLDRTVARAHLGCLSAGPQEATDGQWILVLETADRTPKAIAFLDLVFLAKDPHGLAVACLHKAGYEIGRSVVIKPWTFSWEIARNWA